MKIAELSRRTGVTRTTIRWYEQAGVLPKPSRRPNGYRDYDTSDLARLRLVASFRRLVVEPIHAGRLARLCVEGGSIDSDLTPLLAQQHLEIARQRADLERLESELIDLELTIVAAQRRSIGKELLVTDQPIRVLFVCTHNSARSQIAEALLSHFGGTDFEVVSAGTESGTVNPFTVRALAEMGIDWSAARSKAVGPYLTEHFDYVITVCDRAREACPVFPGAVNSLHWGLDDPAEVEGTETEKLAAFRRTGLEVSARVRPFIEVALRAAGRTRRAALVS